MANVEVQLDVKAEYKQALMAIASLGKALDAVQQRAKVALTVSGGAQGGSQGTGGTGEAETQQKAAVEALSAAMKDAAAAAATLAESVAKLTPALKEMGPQAEQVQQVLTLAEHYKQLAAAMGIAADAAAKYNASGAQQGETDARIQKLMEENQKLMELVSNIRAEYAEIVKRNAELNRTKTAREESSRSAREELEVEEDLTYVMQLAAMSKRELTAEIARLTKERKEAAKAGDEAKYKELTEELKLARQAMTKLRQEQQLARIAWMQQAQTAQQMGQSVRTLTDGFMNFGESVENGTVNLTGMVTAVTSLSLAIKAGLGPLGWALAAVELLTTAWNMYAKSQKEAEEAEKKSQERIVKLTTAYHEAAAEAQKFKDQEARKAEINELIARYDTLNDRLRERNTLLETGLRIKQAELTMEAKEDERAITIEQHEIMRSYYRGEIDEEEMKSRLDRLKIKQAKNKKKQVARKGRLDVDMANAQITQAKEELESAKQKRYETYEGSGALLGTDERLYGLDPATMKTNAAAYNEALQSMQDLEKTEKERLAKIKKDATLAYRNVNRETTSPEEIARLREAMNAAQAMTETNELRAAKDKVKNILPSLKGWSVEQIESGEYGERYKTHKEKLKITNDAITKAEDAVTQAEEKLTKALEKKADVETQLAIKLDLENQNISLQYTQAGQNVMTRQAKKEFEERKKKEREEEQAKKRAAEAARKEAERRAKLQSKAITEGEYEGNLTKQARAIARGGGYKMLADNKLTKEELQMLINTAQKNSENEAYLALIKDILVTARKNNAVTMERIREQRAKLEKLNINLAD